VSELWHIFLFYSFLMSFTASITMVPMMAAIQLDHDNANVYISPGTNYNVLGQYELSIADNTKALQIGGNYDACSYYTRGLSYRALGQTSDANADKRRLAPWTASFADWPGILS
jgi:tetratricopeptide (TPR) repeat protein